LLYRCASLLGDSRSGIEGTQLSSWVSTVKDGVHRNRLVPKLSQMNSFLATLFLVFQIHLCAVS
jgi:hypothetical protein